MTSTEFSGPHCKYGVGFTCRQIAFLAAITSTNYKARIFKISKWWQKINESTFGKNTGKTYIKVTKNICSVVMEPQYIYSFKN